ncbi:11796_t:CDS:2, partial [Gigaspora margarita]
LQLTPTTKSPKKRTPTDSNDEIISERETATPTRKLAPKTNKDITKNQLQQHQCEKELNYLLSLQRRHQETATPRNDESGSLVTLRVKSTTNETNLQRKNRRNIKRTKLLITTTTTISSNDERQNKKAQNNAYLKKKVVVTKSPTIKTTTDETNHNEESDAE